MDELGRDAGHGRGVDDVVRREHAASSGSAKDASSTRRGHRAASDRRAAGRSGRAAAGPPARTAGRRRSGPRTRRQRRCRPSRVRSRGRATRTGRRRPTTPRRRRRARARRRSPRPLAQDPRGRGGEHQPGQCHWEGEADVGCGPLGIGVGHVEPHRPTRQAAATTSGTYDASAARGRAGPAVVVRSREQYHRGGVPPSGDRGPASTGRPGGDRRRDRSPCRAGRRDGESFGMPQTAAPPPHRTGVTTVTIQHSPAPARSDVATAAPGTATSPTRPFLLHGRMLSAGAVAWSASILAVGQDPQRHDRPGRLRTRLRPVPGRPALPAPHAVAHPALGDGRIARGVLRFEAFAVSMAIASTFVDADRRLRPQPARPGSLLDALLAAVDARHVPHRHPDRDRRPLDGPDPLLADGRRELGRRHHPRDGDLRRARSASGRRASTSSSATPSSACWSAASATDCQPPTAAGRGSPLVRVDQRCSSCSVERQPGRGRDAGGTTGR